jgi:DsbC/DsbD-like thiol-disulfide interchange protein
MRLAILAGLSLTAASLAAPVPTPAQARRPPAHARVTLVADTATISANGGQTTLGLHFDLDDHWHVYWRNPGGSGSPPSAVWTLPEGLRAGDIQWPVPSRIDADGIIDYGYDREVLLLVPLASTSGLRAGSTATVAARVDYVICSDVCVKETASVTLTLPVVSGRAGASTDAIEFSEARGRLPKPMPASWRASASLGEDSIDLTLTTGSRVSSATFFPTDPGVIDDSADQIATSSATGLTLGLKKSSYFLKTPPALEGVLVVPGQGAFVINAPWRKIGGEIDPARRIP